MEQKEMKEMKPEDKIMQIEELEEFAGGASTHRFNYKCTNCTHLFLNKVNGCCPECGSTRVQRWYGVV